jgi:hypothetical protein
MASKKNLNSVLLTLFTLLFFSSYGQMITGTWTGKIGKQKAEIKIVQRGDSITGTSYYYESVNSFRRFTIKGYFDKNTNEVVWWDDKLVEEKYGRLNNNPQVKWPLESVADFNCPGGGKMMLDGKAIEKYNQTVSKGEVHLDKTDSRIFNDEWDYVIENFTMGTNDPFIIDSVETIAAVTTPVKDIPAETEKIKEPAELKKEEPVLQKQIKNEPSATIKKEEIKTPPTQPKAIEKKFVERTKVFTKEIPIAGDSIELRFYDNGEVDGDSISLFLNDKLVFEHIRLTADAYTIKLSVNDLKQSNELVMVAENLGSIPPNTSYMVAIVKDQRYDARLASTEGSSAMIRLVKAQEK